MSQHVAVRFKGSRWRTTAHRAAGKGSHGAPPPKGVSGRESRLPSPVVGEDDLLLDLAVRHFVELQPTSREAEAIAAALSHTVTSGQRVSVHPEASSAHAYEFSRRVASITIRFGDAEMQLPLHAALQLADVLRQMHKADALPDIAA